jgi:hypothetical protein
MLPQKAALTLFTHCAARVLTFGSQHLRRWIDLIIIRWRGITRRWRRV